MCTASAFGNTCGIGLQAPDNRNYNLTGKIGKVFSSSVHPNPFSGKVAINITAPEAGKAEITVFNQLGAKVYSSSLQLSQNRVTTADLDLNNLPCGIYLLRVSASADILYHKNMFGISLLDYKRKILFHPALNFSPD